MSRDSRRARRDEARPTPPRPRPRLTTRQKVRRWLLWLLPIPCIVAFGFGILFATAQVSFDEGMGYYRDGEFYDARQEWKRLAGTVPEPWKGSFAYGTAALQDESWWGAVDALDDALAGVPEKHRCDVQTNRALAYEGYGDELAADAAEQIELATALLTAETARAAGEPYDESLFELPYEGADEPTSADTMQYGRWLLGDARDAYAVAADAAAEPACASSGGGGGSDDEQDPSSSADPSSSPTAPSGGGDGSDESPSGGDEQQDPREQAAERNEQKMREASDLEQQLGRLGGDGTDQGQAGGPGGGGGGTDEGAGPGGQQGQLEDRNREANGDPSTGGTGGDQPGGGTSGW